jgi:hypothetical protein
MKLARLLLVKPIEVDFRLAAAGLRAGTADLPPERARIGADGD